MANNDDKGMNPVAAAVVGAAAGLAVGATVAVLADEKNRKAIGDKFNDVKGEVEKVAGNVGQQAHNVATEASKKVDEAKKAVKSKL